MIHNKERLGKEAVVEKALLLQKKFQNLSSVDEAKEALQEVVNHLVHNGDRHSLTQQIIDFHQLADDLQFRYYKARCTHVFIPPKDALSFWIALTLGSLPESSRIVDFQGEVFELLKLLTQALTEPNRGDFWSEEKFLTSETEIAMTLIKTDYPVFFNQITRIPILIPYLNFSLKGREEIFTIPRLHCLGFFHQEKEDSLLVPILHGLAHLIHYQLTEDLEIMPPGFWNLHNQIFDDNIVDPHEGKEIFAEIFTASLLYDTEFMPLIAYMEFCQIDQEKIKRYFSWLERIFISCLKANMQKVIHHYKECRQA